MSTSLDTKGMGSFDFMDVSALPKSLRIALLPALLVPGILAGQIPDTIQVDTSRVPVYEVRGLTILVPRPVSTTGGASAIEVPMDSVVMRPAPTLEQVLRELPLIQIRTNSRGEAQPALRGGEDRQIAVLMDGVPLTLGWDARTDLSVIPLTAAQRVNVIRGLSSVLHGPNVLGGVVEVDIARGAERQSSPRPLQLDLGVDHVGGRSVGLSGGKSMDTSGGAWVLRAGAGHQARDGLALPGSAGDGDGQDLALLTEDGELRLNTDLERYDGFFSARYHSDGGTWMSLSTSGVWTERGVAPEAHVAEPRLWRYPDQSRWISAFSWGTGQRSTAWGEGDLEATLGIDLGSLRIDEFASPAYEETSGGESSDDLTLTLRLEGDHSLGARGELRGAFTYADVKHDEREDGGQELSFRQRLWSLGSEAEWRLGGLSGSKGTRVTLGLAIDGADTPRSGDKPPLEALWDWGGRLGFTSLTGVENLLFHGALSRRTRFPALRELYSGALGRFIPNPDLKPEILSAGELGFTLTEGDFQLQAVGFYQSLSDGIVRSSVDSPEGRKYKRINQDKVRSTGLELLASGPFLFGTLSGDVTLQKVRGVDAQGNEARLEYEPELAGKISTILHLPLSFEGGASARYMAKQYCENPEMGGLQSFGSSKHLDLSLRRVFSLGSGLFGRAEAVANVDNATDAVVLDQCGLPQPGRTLRVQIRLW